MPPARVCQFVNILVSDSALCMITGPKNNPKKHTMEKILNEQSGPDCSCVEFIHVMKWGATLRTLVKTTMEIVEDARKRHPEMDIIVAVYWNGNELVGKGGIEQSPVHPFTMGEEDPEVHMQHALRHTETLMRTCRENDVSSVAVMGVSSGAPYKLGYNFSNFMVHYQDRCRKKFGSDYFARSDAEPAFFIIDMVELAWQLELRDHYHMQLSDSNQHQCLVYILSLFYELAMAGRKDLPQDWRYALKKLAEDNRRDVREIVPNPKRNQNLRG